MGFESMSPRKPEGSIDDYQDVPDLFNMMKRLPLELRATHLVHIEESGMSDDDALAYIQSIVERREEALREGEVSDPGIREYFESHQQEIWQALETEVFSSKENRLGEGQTARVKRYVLQDAEKGVSVPLAIKYLITPTEMTLSASGEHDLIREVERIQLIEQAEASHLDETLHLRVPHPYFHYKHGKLQCYGMELIEGTDLELFMDGKADAELVSKLQEKFSGIDRAALMKEVEIFFDAMHEVCIHGDIKLKNFMVNEEGRFYVIDFGQSRLMTDFGDKERESIDTKKDDEKAGAKTILTHFLNKLEV